MNKKQKFSQINRNMQSTTKSPQGNKIQVQKMPKFFEVEDLGEGMHYVDVLTGQPVLVHSVTDGIATARMINKITGEFMDYRPLDNQLYKML